MGALLIGIEKVAYLVYCYKIYKILYIYSSNLDQALANL